MLPLILAFASLSWGALDAETEKEVPRFVKMDVGDMTPGYIEHMLKVDAKDVPEKLRKKFEAKKLELYTMKQLGEGKRKGTIRMPEKDCAALSESKSQDIKALLMVGYTEVFDHEIVYLQKNTRCTERQMMCEFSLQIVLEKKAKFTEKRYFLHAKDPLMALVSQYREKGGSRDTNFFGGGIFPTCN